MAELSQFKKSTKSVDIGSTDLFQVQGDTHACITHKDVLTHVVEDSFKSHELKTILERYDAWILRNLSLACQ